MTVPDGPTRAVELAYPLERDGVRYAPDSTVELPTDEAKQLVRDGRARWSTNNTNAGPSGTEGGE